MADQTREMRKDGTTTQTPKPPTRLNVLAIGIDKYKGFNPLNNAVKDAKDVIRLLQKRYGFSTDRTYTLFDGAATRQGIYGKLQDMRKLTEDDSLLIYFSGHGHYDKELDLGYWIPVDATNNDPSGYLENTTIVTYLKALKCRHILLIADACFSGSLFGTRSTALDRLSWMKSRWGITSGRLEVVSDGAAGSNSPFADYLINFLSQQTEPFSAAELSTYLVKAVGNNADQLPQGGPMRNVGDDGGEFVFFTDGKVPEKAIRPTDEGPKRETGTTINTPTTPPTPPPSTDTIFQRARKLLADGQLGEALALMMEAYSNDSKYSNALIQFSSRFNRLRQQINSGSITDSSANVQSNQLTNSLLDIVGRIEKGDYL